MKKFLLSALVIVSSATYVLYQYVGGGSTPAQASTPPLTQSAPAPTSPSAPAVPPPPSQPTPPVAVQPKPAVPKPKGQYADGSYTGSTADAYYGTVQVQATISGGKLTNVAFLQYPDTHGTSVYINQQAMPYLTQEALQAQSANVDIISGATFTSQAFEQSLAAALSKAKA